MTVSQAKEVLRHPSKIFVLSALSYVNLGDLEADVLIYRYMRKHTQEEAAEEFERSVNGIQIIEKEALKKCAAVWAKSSFVSEVMKC